ncbi:rhomboid family intramembrane serine protease [Bacillus sp. V3B]|uniref:rhomboid family intramembrane serine protease n=1 Tax=Bacillus sp. V3B TaxID=2804915 RepID=UPI002811EE35|nr:rhomboid family intramembrane serine protease [Bacillus sp. V3B]MCQ6277078.1 rhomboid family intramembrane serine protease [Bacillus sp. V3B]
MGGTFHILANLACLIIFAPPLERIYGSVKFTFLFLATGMVGGLFILIFSENVIAAGASGSIFGLIGLYLGLVITRNKMINSQSQSVIWSAFVGNILYTFLAPNISIAAHLGGLFSGLILSFFVRPQSFQRLAKSKWSLTIFQIALISLLWFSLLSLPKYLPIPMLSEWTTKLEQVKSFASEEQAHLPTISMEKLFSQITGSENVQVNKNNVMKEPSFQIVSVRSGVEEGWINTSGNFVDEVILSIHIENKSEETVDIYPEMFILSDTAGVTPSLQYEGQYFEYIPLSPMQQVTIELVFAVHLKTTTGDFLLSVSGWNAYDRFQINYTDLLTRY